MGFIKNALIGIAIFEGIKYLAKKDALGISNWDKLTEQAPEWVDAAKNVVADVRSGRVPNL